MAQQLLLSAHAGHPPAGIPLTPVTPCPPGAAPAQQLSSIRLDTHCALASCHHQPLPLSLNDAYTPVSALCLRGHNHNRQRSVGCMRVPAGEAGRAAWPGAGRALLQGPPPSMTRSCPSGSSARRCPPGWAMAAHRQRLFPALTPRMLNTHLRLKGECRAGHTMHHQRRSAASSLRALATLLLGAACILRSPSAVLWQCMLIRGGHPQDDGAIDRDVGEGSGHGSGDEICQPGVF